MAQAPPANVVTGEDRSGSPARSRGTCQRAPGPPSGSATRNEITARPGSAAKRLATCEPSWGSGNQPSSSRKSTTSPPHASTPALRPPATPRFSGSLTTLTPGGTGPTSAPFPTATTSRPSPCCASALPMARASSAGRSPIVRITHESFIWSPQPPGRDDRGQMRDDQEGGDDQAGEQEHAGGGQVAGEGVDDRGQQDQQGELDGVDDAVQLEGGGEPAGQRQAGAAGGEGLVGGRLGQAGLGTGDDDVVGLGLDQHRQEGRGEAGGDVGAGEGEVALSAKAEAREQGGFAEVVADPVEVDAGSRGTAAPAGQFAVRAVEQQVGLDEDRGDDGRPQAAERDHHAGGDPADDEGHRDRVRRPAQAGEDPGRARRHPAHVKAAGPVLIVKPLKDCWRLAGGPQLSQRRTGHTPPLASPPPPRSARGAPGWCTGRGGCWARSRPPW